MKPLISRTMIHYILNGERNLSFDKAKIIGKMTKTDPLVWIDPSKIIERKAAWVASFPKRRKR